MALINIQEVAGCDQQSERLWGASIDLPKAGTTSDVHAIEIAGWVLGRGTRVEAVKIVHEGTPLKTIPIGVPRPDVARLFSGVETVDRCGFHATVGMLGVAPNFQLSIEAIAAPADCVPLGIIRGHRQPLRTGFQPALRPLMVTALGRTGSVWLMRLLAEHPQIVTHRAYPYETRSASYWLHTLRVLAEPADHIQSAHPDGFISDLSWAGHNPYYQSPVMDSPLLRHWFGCAYPEQLSTFCQSAIEAFYQQLALSQGQARAVCFAEKFHVRHIPSLVWELYSDAREVFLVRDFRDMIASMLAYNAKRGYDSFGREAAATDDEFIHNMRAKAFALLRGWQSRGAQAHLIRYEDLVSRPRETLGGLLNYAGLEATPTVVDGMIQRASEPTPEIRQHQTSAETALSIGRWQRDLDPKLQELSQQALGDILNEFGYATEGR